MPLSPATARSGHFLDHRQTAQRRFGDAVGNRHLGPAHLAEPPADCHRHRQAAAATAISVHLVWRTVAALLLRSSGTLGTERSPRRGSMRTEDTPVQRFREGRPRSSASRRSRPPSERLFADLEIALDIADLHLRGAWPPALRFLVRCGPRRSLPSNTRPAAAFSPARRA